MSRVRTIGPGIVVGALLVSVMAPATAAGGPAPCSAYNVTQGTAGTSLIRMVEKAVDGDLLRVRGTCRGEIVIDVDIVIRGVGDDATLTGRDVTRVVRIKGWATVTLRDLTIVDGRAMSPLYGLGGGGILNRGTLLIRDAMLRDNRTMHGNPGGGIANHFQAEASLVGVIVVGNRGGQGGGAWNHGRMRIVGSVVRGNRAQRWEEGDEREGGDGGGIYNGRRLSLERSVVRGNTASYGDGIEGVGAGIFNQAFGSDATGVVTLDRASSVLGNTPDDCFGTPAC